MKTSTMRNVIGCIGKCTSGLTPEEFDHVTDRIHKTLTSTKGRKIFKQYLKQAGRRDDLACVNFYEKCCEYIEKDQNYTRSLENPGLECLIEDVNSAMSIAEDLDGVPEIDLVLLERFNEILTTPCRESMLSVLEETKIRLTDHLRNAHRDFKTYALSPCPRTE